MALDDGDSSAPDAAAPETTSTFPGTRGSYSSNSGVAKFWPRTDENEDKKRRDYEDENGFMNFRLAG
jgi:hypothetical protein